MTSGAVRAAIVTGCVAPRDAVSNIARQQADALARPAGAGRPRAEVRVFCQGAGAADSRVRVVPDAARLAADPFFRAADLIVFHFAIRYELIAAVHLAPRTARVLGYYHGVTPPALCRGDARATAAESLRQAHHLLASDGVLTTSRYLAAELAGFGVAPDRVAVVPPPVAVAPAPRPARSPGSPVRLLYVGRFVPSKGVTDLLEAFRAFAADHPGAALDLAGSRGFSDAAYLHALRAAAAAPDLRGRVRFHLDQPAARLADLYAVADAFVLPSYHEGFGVPIVEALAAGCPVVCSDAGACPETAGGLGPVFRAGDVGDLAARLAELAAAAAAGLVPTAAGPVPAGEWAGRAAAYAATFSRAAFEDRFRAAALAGVRPLPAGVRAYLAKARDRVLAGVERAGVPAEADEPGVYETFRKLRAA